jgi:peptidoglycan hydrolase-like protein with peptidoglycan-binding domain
MIHLKNVIPREFQRLSRKDKIVTVVLAAGATGGLLLLLDRFHRSTPRAPAHRYSTRGAWTDMATKLGITIGSSLDVKSAQHYLNQIANAGLKETGVLDAATSEALRKFQGHNGIEQSGIIDDETGNALQYLAAATSKGAALQKMVTLSPSAPSGSRPWADAVAKDPRLGPPFDEVVQMSAKGAQRALNDLMHVGLPLSGTLDAATTSALQSFQSQQGLPVTGQLDSETANALLYLATASASARTVYKPSSTPAPPPYSPYLPPPAPSVHGEWAVGLQSTQMYDPKNYYGDPKPYWPASNIDF